MVPFLQWQILQTELPLNVWCETQRKYYIKRVLKNDLNYPIQNFLFLVKHCMYNYCYTMKIYITINRRQSNQYNIYFLPYSVRYICTWDDTKLSILIRISSTIKKSLHLLKFLLHDITQKMICLSMFGMQFKIKGCISK